MNCKTGLFVYHYHSLGNSFIKGSFFFLSVVKDAQVERIKTNAWALAQRAITTTRFLTIFSSRLFEGFSSEVQELISGVVVVDWTVLFVTPLCQNCVTSNPERQKKQKMFS